MYKIEFYQLANGKEPVKEWLLSLDKALRVKVIKRLERVYENNFGDYKQIVNGLFELRFSFGKGYRIYYTIQNNVIVLLLNAGDKSKQSRDIEIAKVYLKQIGDKNV